MSEPGTFTLRAYVCVNCQTKSPANCRIVSGPEARRCVVGHINGTKLCRESLNGYTRTPIAFNECDTWSGESSVVNSSTQVMRGASSSIPAGIVRRRNPPWHSDSGRLCSSNVRRQSLPLLPEGTVYDDSAPSQAALITNLSL